MEMLFFAVSLTAFVYAIAIRRSACRDDVDRPGNGGIEIISRSTVERTTTMVVALGFLLAAGIVSLFMPPPEEYAPLNDQAVIFRFLVMCAAIVIMYKLRREQVNRHRYNEYVSRKDKRASDRHK